jgi:uncharacterized protein (DUF1778 family)
VSNKQKADIPVQVNLTSDERDFIDGAIGHLTGRVSRSGFMAAASLKEAQKVIAEKANEESLLGAIKG